MEYKDEQEYLLDAFNGGIDFGHNKNQRFTIDDLVEKAPDYLKESVIDEILHSLLFSQVITYSHNMISGHEFVKVMDYEKLRKSLEV